MKKETKLKISALFMLVKLLIVASSLFLLLGFKLYFLFFIVLLFYYILNFIALFGVMKNKRTNNQNKFIWTIVLLFMPGVGAYIYYSTSWVPKKNKKIFKASDLLKNDKNDESIDSDILLLDSGDEKFEKLFIELSKAKSYINIEYFIITEGIIFSKLKEVLIDRVKAGVKIRILYDYVGSGLIDKKAFKELINLGVEVIEFGKINLLQTNGSNNFRNHNKIVVIDGKKAFFGGLNMSDEYAMIDSYYGDWYDTHFLLEGRIVKSLNEIFVKHWFLGTKKNISKEFSYPVYKKSEKYKNTKLLIDSPYRSKPVFYNELIDQINKAKKSIKIITPYVIIPTSLRAPITDAIIRGVKIEMITIGRPDKKIPYFVGKFELDTLYDIGVNIYRTKNIFCHTKLFIFDDNKAIFGTTNLDFRALFLHFETNIYLEGKKLSQFIDHFESYKNKSEKHTLSRREWNTSKELIYLLIRFFKGAL